MIALFSIVGAIFFYYFIGLITFGVLERSRSVCCCGRRRRRFCAANCCSDIKAIYFDADLGRYLASNGVFVVFLFRLR